MPHAKKSVTINHPKEHVYESWRDFENLGRFMQHIENAKITREIPGERIEWQSLPGNEAASSGSVVFRDAPGDRGTEVTAHLDCASGDAKPDQLLRDDLRRFKQVIETGEVVRSDGSLGGAGQGATRQRHAQPADARDAAEQMGGAA